MSSPNPRLIERLKQAMQSKQINARELAERAQVGRSFIYDILRGKSLNPTTQKLSAVADVLEVNVGYLVGSETSRNALVLPEGLHSNIDNSVAVPLLEVEPTASGNVLGINDAMPRYFDREWIQTRMHGNLNNLRVYVVDGRLDSLAFKENDILLIDTGDCFPAETGTYLSFDAKCLHELSANAPVLGEVVGRVIWFAREL